MGGMRTELPAALAQLQRRFVAWRKSRSARERIPESLWRAAAKVAAKHGLNRTASVLILDYYSLKKRVDQLRLQPPLFVELPSSPATSECTLEMEDPRGARMRVHLKGQNLPDLLSLSRLFWDGV